MAAALSHHYGPAFFAGQSSGSRNSARVVIPEVARLLSPTSVLDVGCGAGTWLAEWRELGVDDVLGIDGDYVDPQQLQIAVDRFRPTDLSRPVELGRRFDVVECLEVAEHLEEGVADTLVGSLARHGDVVLFSAAIPGQGGTHHVNERWPSYWVPKFQRLGFEVFDVIRPRIWGDRRVEPWYRQNVMIFARGSAAGPLTSSALPAMPVLDVVHPDLFALFLEARSSRSRQILRRSVPRRARAAVTSLRGLRRSAS
jgi:SAM-dependent methyltransferase